MQIGKYMGPLYSYRALNERVDMTLSIGIQAFINTLRASMLVVGPLERHIWQVACWFHTANCIRLLLNTLYIISFSFAPCILDHLYLLVVLALQAASALFHMLPLRFLRIQGSVHWLHFSRMLFPLPSFSTVTSWILWRRWAELVCRRLAITSEFLYRFR